MRCYNCGVFTLLGFCQHCLAELGDFSLGSRSFFDEKRAEFFKVYYFYKYSSIKHLLHSKHKFYGYFVLRFLARLSFGRFEDFFRGENLPTINALPLDDRVKNALYSHSAILARALKSKHIKPIFGALQAQNELKYSGKSLSFRQKNKRKFKLLKPLKHPVILVDDIITTGSSMLEARAILEKKQISVLFGLVLADAKE